MADNLLDKLEERRKEMRKDQEEKGIGTLVGLRDLLKKKQAKYNLPEQPKKENESDR